MVVEGNWTKEVCRGEGEGGRAVLEVDWGEVGGMKMRVEP